MSYTLLGHTFAQASTTGSVDTSGADLIVVGVPHFTSGNGTITDSKGNTYTNLTQNTDSNVIFSYMAYTQAPTVGSGHTFTVGAGPTFPSIFVAWFSGSTSTPFETETGNNGAAMGPGTIAPGSITPSENNELFVTLLGLNEVSGTPISIDSGFTITDSALQIPGVAIGGGMAYFIQTTAGAKNPTWTLNVGYFVIATMAIFKDTAGGGVTVKQLAALGVG